MSRIGKPQVIYAGHDPEQDRRTTLAIAGVALVFWALALATVAGWLLSWV